MFSNFLNVRTKLPNWRLCIKTLKLVVRSFVFDFQSHLRHFWTIIKFVVVLVLVLDMAIWCLLTDNNNFFHSKCRLEDEKLLNNSISIDQACTNGKQIGTRGPLREKKSLHWIKHLQLSDWADFLSSDLKKYFKFNEQFGLFVWDLKVSSKC